MRGLPVLIFLPISAQGLHFGRFVQNLAMHVWPKGEPAKGYHSATTWVGKAE